MHLYEKQPVFRWKGIIITAVIFLLLIVLFSMMITRTSATADREQAEHLQQAIRNAAVTHYAVEGKYPASLEEIVDLYGVIIDNEQFIVRYNIFASNIMPGITVLNKGEIVNESTAQKVF